MLLKSITRNGTSTAKIVSAYDPYVYVCRVWVFFIVDICISLCLRAPRKIDSSIGLPSLNKVVTYLLMVVNLN